MPLAAGVFWCTLAHAEPPEEEPVSEEVSASEEEVEEPETDEPLTIELSLPDDLGGSALDGLDEDARAAEGSVPLPLALPTPPLRGRFAVRPVFVIALLDGSRVYWATRVGLAITHRYWRLTEKTVQVAGETELRALAPVGGATGRRFALSSVVGPWVGPVGLRLGPVVRSDRVEWRNADAVLADTLALGGRVDLSLEAGPWRASVGCEAAWLAAGNRPPADPETATLPVLGDETAYRLGVGRQGDRLFTALHATWRETAIGAEIDTGVQFGLRLF